MKNLVKAMLAVMADVENIDKNMNVGAGAHSYKGVSDKDVKIAVGKAMQKHGLVLFPISVEPTIKIDRWEEDTYYNGNKNGVKTKQSVFTEVITEYLLMHESGESQIIKGYGHGVDSMDKSAGKATTYALKNALLYTFLVPTGAIDDTDKTNSEDAPVPETKANKKDDVSKTLGIAPSLTKVIKNANDADSLNAIWKNNKLLHENAEFLKLIAMRRIDFADTTVSLSKIFDGCPLLHLDSEFVSTLTAKKKALINTDQKKTA